MLESTDKRITEVINFEAINLPQPTEDNYRTTNRWVNWGLDNLYPNFLLDLYGNSPIHSSIINSKVSYIIGNGLKTISGEKVSLTVNASDTFPEFISKVIKDYLIFNYFCVEVVYNQFNQALELHHVPAHRVRTNKNKDAFWYCEDWRYSKQPILYKRWQKNNPDSNTKLFFYDGYFPSVYNTYPEPEYKAALKSITTDMAIRDFNLNNIRNHFSVSTIITFFKSANVPEDIQRSILRDLKNSYTGESGNKLIVDFQSADGKAADVKNIAPNEWDKAYLAIKQTSSDDIFIGHEVTSPMLFGVKTEGQLGGASELEVAYEVFKANYITNKRNELVAAFNMLFVTTGFVKGTIQFEDKPLFGNSVSEAMKEKIMTINELRAEVGLASLPDGDKLLIQKASPAQAFSDEKKSHRENVTQLTEDDYEKIKHLGVLKVEYDFVEENFASADDAKTVAEYLLENASKASSIDDIQKAIKNDLDIDLSVSELKDVIGQINDAGLLKITVKGNNLTVEKPTLATRKTEVLYSYDVRPGLGNPIIKNTRAFCVKLIGNDRFYKREEIQSMSEIFGYDVFTYCGGFYTNPDDGETTPYCRHQWKKNTVVRKN